MFRDADIKKWNNVHALALLLSLISVIIFKTALLLSILCLFSFLWLIISNITFLKSYRPFAGYANWITFLRLCCTLLIGFFYSVMDDAAVAATAFIVIVMDGFDGYVARRFKTAGKWGANFDMETDAFFVCLMASIIYIKDYLGAWILLTGYMRYIYVVLKVVLTGNGKEEAGSRFGQTIAVILFLSLITPFVLERSVYLPFIAIASLLLIISFVYSFIITYMPGKGRK